MESTLQVDENSRKLPPLPSMLMSNLQSIRNKTSELEANAKFKHDEKNACLLTRFGYLAFVKLTLISN